MRGWDAFGVGAVFGLGRFEADGAGVGVARGVVVARGVDVGRGVGVARGVGAVVGVADVGVDVGSTGVTGAGLALVGRVRDGSATASASGVQVTPPQPASPPVSAVARTTVATRRLVVPVMSLPARGCRTSSTRPDAHPGSRVACVADS
ncbi:hypothetical protein GCM10011314_18680 [Knoellia flava]|uniref:Uncharacterized protein n=1 Tax=Knoellia flava TaxID=913969 RepID=A0A8H9KR84_9MICO|nr:hypothetical protein GCM10011314_18680 [Knoellia flava]